MGESGDRVGIGEECRWFARGATLGDDMLNEVCTSAGLRAVPLRSQAHMLRWVDHARDEGMWLPMRR